MIISSLSLIATLPPFIDSSTGPNSTSQEMGLGQRRGHHMLLVVSTMANSTHNCLSLGEGMEMARYWEMPGFWMCTVGYGER